VGKTNQDRTLVDLTGIRDDVNQAYDSEAWHSLSLSKKCRALIRERLSQLKEEQKKSQEKE
jgi:hypothetical protein